MQNDRPAKWWWCQNCQHCRKLWWSSYIETAAELLPKDGSSKVACPLRLCNVCLFFTWRRATIKIEGFLVVCCLNDESSSWFVCSASVHRQASADRSMVYSTQLHWQHSLQGTRQIWTDLSHHAQVSMCTSRDKMAASRMEFSILIECGFVAVVSWKVGWLCFFTQNLHLDDLWVSFTCPWVVFTRLGRPDKWLVRTLTLTPTLNNELSTTRMIMANISSLVNVLVFSLWSCWVTHMDVLGVATSESLFNILFEFFFKVFKRNLSVQSWKVKHFQHSFWVFL